MASRKAGVMLGQAKQPASSTKNPPATSRTRANTVAPWDEPTPDLARDRDPTDIAPWEQDPQAIIGGTRPFNQSYFNDPVAEGTITPRAFVNSRHNSEIDPQDLDASARRPSVASNDTISSIGSKNSATNGRFHRKALNAFFGDDPSDNSRKGSQTFLAQNDAPTNNEDKQPLRNGSMQTARSEERPKTPLPSSNVTPWDYQNFEDVSKFGTAPIRQELAPDTNGEAKQHSTASAIRSKLLPHRHTKSKDDPPKSSNLASHAMPQRPATSREVSSNNIPVSRNSPSTSTPMSSASNLAKTQTVSSNQEENSLSHKRKFLHKLNLHRHREKQPPPETPQELPRETERPTPGDVQGRARGLSGSLKKASAVPSTGLEKRDRESSMGSVDTVRGPEMPKIDRTTTASSVASKASRLRGLGHHGRTRDRTTSSAQSHSSDTSKKNEPPQTPGIWTIDTNFEDLSDILHQPPGQDSLQPVDKDGRPLPQTPATEPGGPNWDAPDSWAVKGQDGIGQQHHDVAEYGLPAIEEEDGISYFMRVFRSDGTFATLSMTINATVGEVLQSLAKKSVLHDTIENYHLILRKNQLSRQLEQAERPIAMQKKLLLQAGYQEKDHIEEVGREDNSYLCRFTFSHEKQTGFGSGLDNDPSFNKMQKFSHVDLTGRSMITIPIILYTKAPEIISLNLSRNLALAVPKDFITACINLREIKFIGNEAWQIPASLAWASKLNVLDLSNNRLEDLEHAELHRLTGLVSLKLANNSLSKLPNNFSHFRQLRSLNISSNNFKELPEQVYNLKSLAELDVSFNKIAHLTRISSLPTLERLWMTNNDLKGPFNEGFRKLVNLKEVDVRFNGVTNIDNVAGCPNLETLLLGHNSISAFKGSFKKLRTLQLDHNPMTGFDIEEPLPTLNSLNIASAKLVEFKETICDHMPNLQKLVLDKNHFSNVPSGIGKLTKLQHLSMAKNRLNAIPQSIGNLVELKHLNLRECNVSRVPGEIWYCRNLEMLNLSSNVLESFPRINAAPPPPPEAQSQQHKDSNATLTAGIQSSPSFEDLGRLEDFQNRRPSQASTGMLSIGSSPGGAGRKNSMVSTSGAQGRKMSQISRTNTEHSFATATRKDSNLSQGRLHNTFAGSLRYLYLADNRLEDEIFRELAWLQELRMLNLSYNEIDDFPSGVLRRWPQLTDLYLSGNSLTSLPSEDFEENSNLRNLYLNVNRFQVLPAELCNVHKLSVLDVGSNSLKYNVSNWPYDWNWNRNTHLKYLNFSANRRLEIKPAHQSSMNQYAAMNGGEHQDLTSFTTLKYLRVLGLMDVTLLTNTIPDDNEDRRVRTSTTSAGALLYGMADTLGKNDHLSTLDLLKDNFRGHDAEIIVGMFDGQSIQSGGSRVAKYLHEHFASNFQTELNKADREEESPEDALRRSFLSLNKEMANFASSAIENREHRIQHGHRTSTVANLLSTDDLNAGCVVIVLYLNGLDLYVANVGDIEAISISANGQSTPLTTKHQPAETAERDRIRAAGGYVSRQGKLNDTMEVSRAFGYFNAMPSIIASPSTHHMTISEADELIVIATKEFWDFVTVDLAVDLVRSEKTDLMVAAQKLRDIAIAFGARDKIMVQVLGVTDLRKRNNTKYRAGSFSVARELNTDPDNIFPSATRKRKGRDGVADSELARMEEPEAPTGEVAICFTDIKNSTALWEILPVPMRGAIQLHNQLMRRQLRIVGGYEVKTEGDAFMCSFPTVTSALLWTFIVQNSLLDLQWPNEILDTVHCQEKYDADGNVIYRGLSVRMGMHWGRPVCEPDPITRRMDYFGPMVNKAARVSAVADGGQISVSTDFISEMRRTLEAFAEDDDRRDSVGSNDTVDDPVSVQIRKELRQLSSLGFEVKELGEKKLKGLENPEFIYLMYPHGLSGRLEVPPGAGDQPANLGPQGEDKPEPGTLEEGSSIGKGLDLSEVWKLWDIALRLEMFCSSLEDPDRAKGLRKPEMSLLTNMRDRGGQIGDNFMVNLLEHQVTRVENCVSALQIRHMMTPLKMGISLADQAQPIKDILVEVANMMEKYKGVNTNQEGSLTKKVQELDEDDDD